MSSGSITRILLVGTAGGSSIRFLPGLVGTVTVDGVPCIGVNDTVSRTWMPDCATLMACSEFENDIVWATVGRLTRSPVLSRAHEPGSG